MNWDDHMPVLCVCVYIILDIYKIHLHAASETWMEVCSFQTKYVFFRKMVATFVTLTHTYNSLLIADFTKVSEVSRALIARSEVEEEVEGDNNDLPPDGAAWDVGLSDSLHSNRSAATGPSEHTGVYFSSGLVSPSSSAPVTRTVNHQSR